MSEADEVARYIGGWYAEGTTMDLRRRARTQGMVWPPPPRHSALIQRAIAEAPGALGNAIDCSRNWDDVARRTARALDAMR